MGTVGVGSIGGNVVGGVRGLNGFLTALPELLVAFGGFLPIGFKDECPAQFVRGTPELAVPPAHLPNRFGQPIGAHDDNGDADDDHHFCESKAEHARTSGRARNRCVSSRPGDSMSDNHWDLVQTPTGKVISRANAQVLEEKRYVCAKSEHLGAYVDPGNCRLCGEPRIERTVPVGFKEGSA